MSLELIVIKLDRAEKFWDKHAVKPNKSVLGFELWFIKILETTKNILKKSMLS